jgi:hypothetical protein
MESQGGAMRIGSVRWHEQCVLFQIRRGYN